jgi:hypothetical protein
MTLEWRISRWEADRDRLKYDADALFRALDDILREIKDEWERKKPKND